MLVEFDDTGWKSREYIKVHQVFQEFLVEHTLSWVKLKNADTTERQGRWPALVMFCLNSILLVVIVIVVVFVIVASGRH